MRALGRTPGAPINGHRTTTLIRITTALLAAAPLLAATPATAGARAGASPTHTVVAGDTLWEIAAAKCGSGMRYTALAAGNRISNPNLIRIGQRIRITCTASSSSTSSRQARASRTATRASTGRAAAVVAYARAQIGDPYRWGAAGPNAYDCSGLVVAAYRHVGIRLPHYTGDLLGRGHRVARTQLRAGDLVFLSAHHVGLYAGGGKVVVAPHPGARVRVQPIYAFYTARRII